MQSLNLQLKKIELSEYRKRGAVESDFSRLITESTEVYIDGRLAIVYVAPVQENLSVLREALQEIKYSTSTRTSGLQTTSRIFGYAPRNELRNHPCRLVSLATEFPKHHATIENAAQIASKYYWLSNPDLAGSHMQMSEEKLEGQYVLAGTMFTSGIVNENNPLQYHYDSGNYNGVYSAMFGFKQGVRGGYLSVPQLDVGFEIADSSLLLFDGQGLLHGVTPIKKLRKDAKRYSIVYYSLKQMWNCDTPGEELERIRNRRTQIERKPRKVKS